MLHLIEAIWISLILNLISLLFKRRQPAFALARVKKQTGTDRYR